MQQIRPFTSNWAPQLNRFEHLHCSWSLWIILFKTQQHTNTSKTFSNNGSYEVIWSFKCPAVWVSVRADGRQAQLNERVIVAVLCTCVHVCVCVDNCNQRVELLSNKSWMFHLNRNNTLNGREFFLNNLKSHQMNTTLSNVKRRKVF